MYTPSQLRNFVWVSFENKKLYKFCTQEPVLNICFKDLWYTKINLSQKCILYNVICFLHFFVPYKPVFSRTSNLFLITQMQNLKYLVCEPYLFIYLKNILCNDIKVIVVFNLYCDLICE